MTPATSIKGVLLVDGGVVLVRNERDEWELPGGRAEPGESPPDALVREFEEELSVRVHVAAPIDAYDFEVIPDRYVRVMTFGCTLEGEFTPKISEEHSDFSVFPLDALAGLPLPSGYRDSIHRWWNTCERAA